MRDFIDIGRRFRDLNQQELASPEMLASLGDALLGDAGFTKDLLELCANWNARGRLGI